MRSPVHCLAGTALQLRGGFTVCIVCLKGNIFFMVGSQFQSFPRGVMNRGKLKSLTSPTSGSYISNISYISLLHLLHQSGEPGESHQESVRNRQTDERPTRQLYSLSRSFESMVFNWFDLKFGNIEQKSIIISCQNILDVRLSIHQTISHCVEKLAEVAKLPVLRCLTPIFKSPQSN